MKCLAVINIDGEHFECELEHPHEHWGHQNRASGAIWHSHAEHEQWNEYLESKATEV